LDGVEVVLRDPSAPKLWSGQLLAEDADPTFELGGFHDSEGI